MTFQPQHGWAIFDKNGGRRTPIKSTEWMAWNEFKFPSAFIPDFKQSDYTAQQVVVISKEEFERLKEDAWKYKELSK